MTRAEELAEVIHGVWPHVHECDAACLGMAKTQGMEMTIARAVLAHLEHDCGPHHSYRGDPVDCEEYEGLVRAQAAAHSASVLEIQVRMLKVGTALTDLVAWAETVSFVSDHGIRVIGNAKAILAEIASPPSAKGER